MLDDPAEGTLVTKFPNVAIQNIFVGVKCRCDLISYLLTAQDTFTSTHLLNQHNANDSLVNSLFKADIQAKLNKNLQCHPRNDLSNSKWVHLSPQDDCQSGIAQSGNNLLVIGLSVGLLVGC